ncbi:hypothetical protein D3C87_1932590 [compost metagenome]
MDHRFQKALALMSYCRRQNSKFGRFQRLLQKAIYIASSNTLDHSETPEGFAIYKGRPIPCIQDLHRDDECFL